MKVKNELKFADHTIGSDCRVYVESTLEAGNKKVQITIDLKTDDRNDCIQATVYADQLIAAIRNSTNTK